LKQIFQLFKNSYLLFWSDRVAVALTFIVPLVLLIVFGSIFGGAGSEPEGIRLAVLNQSASPVTARIESSLDTIKAFRIIKSYKDSAGQERAFDTTSIKEFVRNGNAVAALVIPLDAYLDTSFGLKLRYYYDPKSDIETRVVDGLLQQTIFSQIPQIVTQGGQQMAKRLLGKTRGREFNRGIASLVGKYFNVDTSLILNPRASSFAIPSPDSSNPSSNFFQGLIQIDRQQVVGQELKNPWATRSVGGWAIMFLLFTMTASSSSLFDERKSGVLLRLLTSPVSRVHILWNKYLFNMSLGILQLLIMFFAGWAIFQIDIFSNFFNLFLVILAASMACTSFGMLLAGFSQTRQQAQGLGTLLILSMSAVGGAWFPTSFMPATMQFFSKLTIVYWSVDAFLEVLWRGSPTLSILPHLGILFGIGALVNLISVRRFQRGHIFD
jgi:ABC-2 type transport system permease protein